MSKTRIYCVLDEDLDQRTLVRATSASQAIRVVTSPRFAAAVATQEQLVRMLGEGETIRDAASEGVQATSDQVEKAEAADAEAVQA